MILLFTDFGAHDIYVGQVKTQLATQAPDVCVIDLLHEVPSYDMRAGAYLLAALHERIPPGAVTVAVVDPGVGGVRRPVAAEVDGRWYVGPDNGLLSVMLGRAQDYSLWRIDWRSGDISDSFHGRDLFAPIAAMLATKQRWPGALASIDNLEVAFDPDGLAQVIYIDHYGNAMTGIPAEHADTGAMLQIGSRSLRYARVFSEVAPGEAFWYRNSIGLVEIAMNSRHAAQVMGIGLGDEVRWRAD